MKAIRQLLKQIWSNNLTIRSFYLSVSAFLIMFSGVIKGQNGLFLPFIDDFSSYEGMPDSSLWQNGNAYVNRCYQYMPPSIGVVTLDILDSTGRIYEQANIYGFAADTLQSQSVRMDSVYSPITKRLVVSDSVYFSFFIQPGGAMGKPWERIGSSPSSKDSVVLQFYKSKQNIWESVWRMNGTRLDSIYAHDSVYFKYVLIPVTDTAYFNTDFRFRFINYGSLESNPSYSYISNADQWNIDYVYMDIHRSYTDTTFRDIAFVNPAQSLIKGFTSVPAKHFKKEYIRDTFDVSIINLHHSTLNSTYAYTISDTNGNILHSYNGGFENIVSYPSTHQMQTFDKHIKPAQTYLLNPAKDRFSSYIVTHIVTDGAGQDAIRTNDTIRYVQRFENYFAYDDGTSESGIGIEPTKSSMLAVGFPLLQPDTLYMVNIYFNASYQNSNMKPFRIHVYDATSDSVPQPNQLIYSTDKLTPQFWQLNKYVGYSLDEPLRLSQGTFFIAVEALSSVYMNIGFDQNNDARGHIFEKKSNSWNEIFLKGAPMIRPYFGYKSVDLEQTMQHTCEMKVYPNPATDYVNILAQDGQITFFDRMGRIVKKGQSGEIYVGDLECGLYIVKSKNAIQKIIISR